MNEDKQNKPAETGEVNEDAGKIFLYEGSTLQTREEFEAGKRNALKNADEDKIINTNVGDGVEREEGLANEGDTEMRDNSSSAETE